MPDDREGAEERVTLLTVDGKILGEHDHMPPRGHYFAQEVGQLAGVSGGTVGQWANYGYIRASCKRKRAASLPEEGEEEW